MKNFKKIALTAMVAALAVGFSAFTPFHAHKLVNHFAKKSHMVTDGFLVQDSEGHFVQLDSPDEDNCAGEVTLNCIYQVTEEGASHIPDESSYDSDDIDNFLDSTWIAPIDNNKGVYTPMQ